MRFARSIFKFLIFRGISCTDVQRQRGRARGRWLPGDAPTSLLSQIALVLETVVFLMVVEICRKLNLLKLDGIFCGDAKNDVADTWWCQVNRDECRRLNLMNELLVP